MRFIDLFAGLGGFHVALSRNGHECVFASEIDDQLRNLYRQNFPDYSGPIVGDIRFSWQDVPDHDILCAGFPCQPFSKSGSQQGVLDSTRGTLFFEILRILEFKRPKYLILENVGNFERHDNGQTWATVRDCLNYLGYDTRGTEHVTSGGPGMISPLDLGEPHSRERFFIVGSKQTFLHEPFSSIASVPVKSLDSFLYTRSSLTAQERSETTLTERQAECIDIWQSIVERLPEGSLPTFPLWSYEWGATYDFESKTPHATPAFQLSRQLGASPDLSKRELLKLMPAYARASVRRFPNWKVSFIQRNRDWYQQYKRFIRKQNLEALRSLQPSLQKLEWNSKDGSRNLRQHILQFRPSGLRVKKYGHIPSLVAMTTTQIPIIGRKGRFLSRREGLKLLGFSEHHALPESLNHAFAALGNGVHVEVVRFVAERVVSLGVGDEYKAPLKLFERPTYEQSMQSYLNALVLNT